MPEFSQRECDTYMLQAVDSLWRERCREPTDEEIAARICELRDLHERGKVINFGEAVARLRRLRRA